MYNNVHAVEIKSVVDIIAKHMKIQFKESYD